MRIFPARFRPVAVYTAIVFPVNKRTGRGMENKIPVTVSLQISFNDFRRFYPQFPCHIIHIAVADGRADAAAAVGTQEAIVKTKSLIMHGMNCGIQCPRIDFCQSLCGFQQQGLIGGK